MPTETTTMTTILNTRVSVDLRVRFNDLCEKTNVSQSQGLRRLIEWALAHDAIPTKTTDMDLQATSSEEEIVTWIYKLLKSTQGNISQQLDEIVIRLTRSHMVSEKFVYHCFGRMILAGVIRLDVG